jgi:8-amino-7-oxononanoate synthase
VTVDATSALFLGLRHGGVAWPQLTTGVPAALREPAAARRVGRLAARLHGADAGVVARSALHALVDVLGGLPQRGDVIAIDAAGYPLARWAARLAPEQGVVVHRYPHHQPPRPAGRGRLFVVTDGWCPGCGRPAPLGELRERAREGRGTLIVDDTLAIGVLGSRSGPAVFGDGSGTVRWCGLDHSDVLVVASLAKAFGAPLAVITGEAGTIEALACSGRNRVHSSPPSAADLAAAGAALRDPVGCAARRQRLLGHVLALRAELRTAGVPVHGLPFPVVSVPFPDVQRARAAWRRMRAGGVRGLVQTPGCRREALLTVLLRADHRAGELDRIARELRP